MAEINDFLRARSEAGLLRVLRPVATREKEKIIVEDKEYIDFSSNDYLGISGHPRLVKANIKAIEEFGTSSSGSRLLSGDSILCHRLEEEVARFKNKEAALVFNSGYQGNLGIISSLFTKGDCIFSDRLNHASIIDGILLSGADFFRFQHNDAKHLELLLKKERAKYKGALVITETVFSMDGDRCPLREIVDLKNKYNFQIFVDEAHATGVFGKNGGGIVEEEGVEEEVDFIIGKFRRLFSCVEKSDYVFGKYL